MQQSRADLNNEVSHAFITNPSGQMTDLGTLGGSNSIGNAVNDSGQVTGKADLNDDTSHAFITDPSGQMTDLGKLAGSRDSQGLGINASGQVVGVSGSRGFVTHDGKMHDLNSLMPFSASRWLISEAMGINDVGQITGYGLYNGMIRAFILSPKSSVTPANITTVVPNPRNDLVKLTETSTTKCLQGVCDGSTTGNYSFTLKLSSATLKTIGLNFSKLNANDAININFGDFYFSGALSDDRKYQLKPDKFKANWVANHVGCTKFYTRLGLCMKTKLLKDTTVSLSGDKKGLALVISGSNAITPDNEYNVSLNDFGRYLLTGLCADKSPQAASMPVDISIQLGDQAITGKLAATCTVTKTSKNKKLKAAVQWLQ